MWGILWHEAFVRGTLLSNSTYLYPLSISSAEFYLYSSLIVKFGGFRWFRTNFIGPNVQSRLRVLHWFSMLGGNREIFVAAQGNVNFLASKGDWNCFISENNTLFSSGFFFLFFQSRLEIAFCSLVITTKSLNPQTLTKLSYQKIFSGILCLPFEKYKIVRDMSKPHNSWFLYVAVLFWRWERVEYIAREHNVIFFVSRNNHFNQWHLYPFFRSNCNVSMSLLLN